MPNQIQRGPISYAAPPFLETTVGLAARQSIAILLWDMRSPRLDGSDETIWAALSCGALPASSIICTLRQWSRLLPLLRVHFPVAETPTPRGWGPLMPFLPVLPDEQASPEVRKIYEEVTRRWGFLPNYFQALGHNAQLLQDQVNLFTNAMQEERGLPKIVKEQIATVVSGINMSSYCLPQHLEILGRMGMDKSLSRRLSIDYKSAPLDPKVMELLQFCEKLTTHPADIERADVENLRRLGWNEIDIFDAVLVTSLFACANRFSAGLGLTPDFD